MKSKQTTMKNKMIQATNFKQLTLAAPLLFTVIKHYDNIPQGNKSAMC